MSAEAPFGEPVALVGRGRAAGLVAALCAEQGRPLRVHPGPAGAADSALVIDAAGSDGAAGAARLPAGTVAAASIGAACAGAAVIVLAVPAPLLPEVAGAVGRVATADQVILCHARGVVAGPGPSTGLLLPEQVLRARCCIRKIGLIGGPLALGSGPSRWPAALVLASRFAAPAAALRALLGELPVALQAGDDVVGVQVAAAMAAATGLALGLAATLELGEMARGILTARGLAEATRLGQALGGRAETIAGLAGMAALWPAAATPPLALAALPAAGKPLPAQLAAAGSVQTVRAVVAAQAALGVQLPLMAALDALLRGVVAPDAALFGLLAQRLELGLQGADGGRR